MKLVKILMSTYNGEAYIKDQLESLFTQTYGNIDIYIRDDGSMDGTVALLEVYEKQGIIHLDRGENLGFIKSFFELIKKSGDADFFAFCDQDDIWKEDKIARALSLLEKKEANKPILYFSDYDYYDQDMNFVSRCKSHKRGPSFQNSLVDCISLGISSVINKTACDMIRKSIPTHCCGHDWWAYMICAGLGEVIYDKVPTVNYRRHSDNVSPGGMGFLKFQVWRIKKFVVNDYFKNVREQLREYNILYGSQLTQDNRAMLALFTQEDHSVTIMFKKIFNKHYFRQGTADEIMIRIMFLIRKL